MPDNDQPMWPSADEDTSSGTGGKTDKLPLPDAPAAQPEQPAVPKVTEEKPSATWFTPNVAPEPIPGVNAPSASAPPVKPPAPPVKAPPVATPPVNAPAPPRGDFADRLGAPRSRPLPKLPQEIPVPPPKRDTAPPQDQATQQLPVKPPGKTPWVPVERNVWPGGNQRETRDRPAEPGERLRNLPPEPPRGAVPSASAGSLARPMRIEPDGRRFEAEATVGIERPADFDYQPRFRPDVEPERPVPPPAPPRPEPTPEPPKKRRRGKLLLIGGLVLLVVVALGIAATMPKVSNRLGLPWAPNAPKGDMPEPVAVTRVLQGPNTSGQAPTAGGVSAVLAGPAGNSALAQLTGSVIDPATGTELWDKGAGKSVTPASTTKVLIAAAALLSLDHNMRLSTKIVQGADPSTVILVGGGDTTLTGLPLGTESPLYPGAAHLDDLVAQVKKAVPNVKKVQVDLTLFKGATTAPGWEAGDAPSTFATQMAPVMADGGRQNAKDNDSMRVANAGSAVAATIASKLNASAGGQATAPKGAKVLGEVKSAPLTELVADTLELSDDTLAEAIVRQVALANGEEASYAGGAKAALKVLKAHGFDVAGVELSDGSGISMLNRIPARLLTQVLAAAAAPDGKNPETPKLRPMLEGLPVAGGTGTLEPRFGKGSATEGKGWVRAKTGTLSGVNTLAGVVLDKDGRVLAFALMSEGSDKDPGRDGLDVVAAALHQCGCG